MTRRDDIDRFGAVANVLAAAVAAFFLARGGSGTMLGPARTDDLPYGDLLTLDRTGAILWLIAALVGLGNAVIGGRALRASAAAAWLGLAAIAMVTVVADGDALGMSRPGGVALSLGLGLTALLSVRTAGAMPSTSR